MPSAEPIPPATEMIAATTATCAAEVTRAVAALTAGVTIWPSIDTTKIRTMRLVTLMPQTVGMMKQAAACRA